MKVVAEGVETPEVQTALHSLGADMIQGYLIAKPLPGEALVAFLEQSRDAQAAAA
jgi:EAL domain-containing protein (putative c-di-GMP-specific phosphodiesterase class I)